MRQASLGWGLGEWREKERCRELLLRQGKKGRRKGGEFSKDSGCRKTQRRL